MIPMIYGFKDDSVFWIVLGLFIVLIPTIALLAKKGSGNKDVSIKNSPDKTSDVLRGIVAGAAMNSIMKDIEKSQSEPDRKSGRCGIFDSELD